MACILIIIELGPAMFIMLLDMYMDFFMTLQIQIDESSVFCCDTLSGVIEPFSKTSILVKFVPQCAIPYCRTVAVIVHDQVGLEQTLL